MSIKEELFENQDLEYRAFTIKLTPNIDPQSVIGVRNPISKTIAKKYKDETSFLDELPHQYYEENIIHVYMINNIKEYETFVQRIEQFLPYVNNWAVCDCLKPRLKKSDYQRFETKINQWLTSKKTYTIRFGIEMLMNFYLDDAFEKKYLEKVSIIRSEEYYVNMMIAWYFATALAKQYEATIPYLQERKLADWTHKKTIRKAIESYRINDQVKQYLRSLL